jgi:hypothetical protein
MEAKLGKAAGSAEPSNAEGSEAAADESAAAPEAEGIDAKEEPGDVEAEEQVESDSATDDSDDEPRKPKRKLSRFERRVKNLNQRLKDSESERTELQLAQRARDTKIADLERRLEQMQSAPPQQRADSSQPSWLDDIMDTGEVPKELVQKIGGLESGQKEMRDAVYGIIADSRADKAIKDQGELPEYVDINRLRMAAYSAIREDGRASAKALAIAVAKELEQQEGKYDKLYQSFLKRGPYGGAWRESPAGNRSWRCQRP